MEVFSTTLASVDTALRIVAAIKLKYEAYKKSTTLLKSIRERLKRFKETLSREGEKFDVSDTAWGVLERIQSDFMSLNGELESIMRRLSVKSKVAKWFSSGKDVDSFGSISTHLDALEKHFDMWAMVLDVTQRILPELRKIATLICRLAVNSTESRENQKRILHMLSSALATRPMQEFIQHPNAELRRAIDRYDGPDFGKNFQHQRILTALAAEVPKLMNKLSNPEDDLGDNHELLERLQMFWNTCTIGEAGSDRGRTPNPPDIEIDISAEPVRVDSLQAIEIFDDQGPQSSRPKARWKFVDKDGLHSMDDLNVGTKKKNHRSRNRSGEHKSGVVKDRTENVDESYAVVPWESRNQDRLNSVDDRHRINEQSSGNRQCQNRLDSPGELDENVFSRSRGREDKPLNSPEENTDPVYHSMNGRRDDILHSRNRRNNESDYSLNRRGQDRRDSINESQKQFRFEDHSNVASDPEEGVDDSYRSRRPQGEGNWDLAGDHEVTITARYRAQSRYGSYW